METSFKTIIVDDEQHAIDSLTSLLSECKEIVIEKTFTSPKTAFDYAVTHYPDLIFPDIQMP